VEGERRWVEFEDIELDESDFDRLGNDFESETTALKIGRIGLAEARVMSQRSLVDYAVGWMKRNRGSHAPTEGTAGEAQER
jgi:aminoglycoside 3-N-acetyltransferase